MILGVLLRNFKTYKNITFIPISNGDKFCGLIGKNGIGKSSILEAFDFYFNDKEFKLNINNIGAPNEECYVVPIFLIEKNLISEEFSQIAEQFSNCVWTVLSGEIAAPTINNNYIEHLKLIGNHIKGLDASITKDTHYLLPLGMGKNKDVSLGIFRDTIFLNSIVPALNDIVEKADANVVRAQFALSPLLENIRSLFQYVYIPKDIEPEKLVQFETKEIQTLLGKKLEDIVAGFLTKEKVKNISKELKQFVEELSDKLPNYKFRAPSTNQPNLKADRIYSLIIQDFFSVRELHKEGGNGKDISLKDLSSGEKQQAILTLINSILSEYRDESTKTLIVAVDEPESSLHISACYDQFEKLHNLSTECCQIIFSSHWYGFIPAMNSGSITNIVIENQNGSERHRPYIFNIYKYREEIKLEDRELGKKQHTTLPIDIMLKSSNDFIQSILMSTIDTGDNCYNWLICEGSSDKVYLEAYLAKEIHDKKLRIIPVCTASEVKNTYGRLAVLFSEIKDKLAGKVFLLIDTDRQSVEFDTQDGLETHLQCRRIVNDEKKKRTELVKIQAALKAPNTDIEDTLNGKIFHQALLWFKDQGEVLLDFIPAEEKPESPSYFAMDLRPGEREKLDEFFNANNGNNKVLFAKKYVELLQPENNIPDWIQSIKDYFS
mgnify:FL=1